MSGTTSELARFFPIANEGAEVRSVAGWVRDGGTRQLSGFRPRAHIVVTWDEVSRAIAEAVAGECVVTDHLPTSAGALDQVTIIGDDPRALEIMFAAQQRGCAVTVIAAPDSPLVSEHARTTMVPPHIPFAEDMSVARTLATLVAVTSPVATVAEELTVLSTLVDEEVVACHPDREEVTNPARTLARTCTQGIPVHVGPARLTRLLAEISIARGVPALSATARQASAFQTNDVALSIVDWSDGDTGNGPEAEDLPAAGSPAVDIVTTLRCATRVAAATVMEVL
ncbi:hypothetical protein [Corynebacterium glucuronolyticum]|uniref:hypothetical protein n=1 Tax=Corynebacterium glucuronolyticum TaxID=39791 RepID=UPI00019C19D2|nr:hypothetical protein [Corynebacterium glucuronolyticum]EEI28343.1 hypothetical protein HMPREF0294_0107 [Corynebacterium glucuronolyticum ATCC 51867]QRO81592.1 hypothetical protein I6J20_06665 [Corynebacterium glucuronolyticum]